MSCRRMRAAVAAAKIQTVSRTVFPTSGTCSRKRLFFRKANQSSVFSLTLFFLILQLTIEEGLSILSIEFLLLFYLILQLTILYRLQNYIQNPGFFSIFQKKYRLFLLNRPMQTVLLIGWRRLHKVNYIVYCTKLLSNTRYSN